jgi:hypothetical protein
MSALGNPIILVVCKLTTEQGTQTYTKRLLKAYLFPDNRPADKCSYLFGKTFIIADAHVWGTI